MGEVYRARDTRLEREVAIKVLPARLSSDPSLRQRLEREAKSVSKLSHPHVCTLHDIGHQDGMDFLVMEYLEGETLEQRLVRKPLPLEEALRYATQIADALARAHKLGITHRDLKPANVMLTKGGAKLMDFGLAKQAGPAPLATALTEMTMEQSKLTGEGTIVGTFQYMAPEQLEGKEADARTDIFAFGELLHEMVTGKPAFSAKSRASLIAAILTTDPPPISQLQPLTPPALGRIVKRCLAKDPDERWQSTSDLASELRWVAEFGSQADSTDGLRPHRPKRKLFLGLIAGALGMLVLALIGGWWHSQPVPRVTRSTLLPPDGTHFAPLYRNGYPALSPDGTQIAFVASRESKISLWVRSLDKLEAVELPGTEAAYFPFWSPDGHSIGFFANGKLWRMDANGGAPVALCNAGDARGGSWGISNEILLGADGITIFRVSAAGGTPLAVSPTRYNAANSSDRWPFFLPDGKHFLYLHAPIGAGNDENEIRFASLDGKTNKLVSKGRYYIPQYAMGWLVVGRSGTLVAQRFNPTSGTLTGEPVQIGDSLQIDDNTASSAFSVSQNGVLVYLKGLGRGGMHYVWANDAGKQLAQAFELGVYGSTRISPDQARIATPIYEPDGDVSISVLDLARGTHFRLASGGISDTPVWSPDGRTIFFANAQRGGHLQVFERPTDGSHAQQLLIATQSDALPQDVSNDGKWLLYQESMPNAPQYAVLKRYPLQGVGDPQLVLDQVNLNSNSVLRPGANDLVAYESSESGRSEVYVTHFPNAGAKYQVSLEGGAQPVWARDGKHLYYLDARQKMNVADIATEKDSVQIGQSKPLFQTTSMPSINGAGYDVTADGRFLVLNWAFESASPLTLVQNWQNEIKK
jgi:eukaryotic-like serine/threonine-protein kinase